MFFVINKDKIVSVFVAVCTVFVLFLMTTIFAKLPEKTNETNLVYSENYTIENNTIEEIE